MAAFTQRALTAVEDERTVLRLRIALRRQRGARQLARVAATVRHLDRLRRFFSLLAPVAGLAAWRIARHPRRRRLLMFLRFAPAMLRLAAA